MDYSTQCSPLLNDFFTHQRVISNYSKKTAYEYFIGLRFFCRFLLSKTDEFSSLDIETIDITSCDCHFFEAITNDDITDYIVWLGINNNLQPVTRGRRIAEVKSLFQWLYDNEKISGTNPAIKVKYPKKESRLPRFLSSSEVHMLLSGISGKHQVRDTALIMVFLGCGVRVSELAGINLTDYKDDHIRVVGKGNKERLLFLPDWTKESVEDYLIVRRGVIPIAGHENAMFLSAFRSRISVRAIQVAVKNAILTAGLDPSLYSAHKLRHTAATNMLHNGVDVRTLQEVLGHSSLNTTQLYTHVENCDLRSAAKANSFGSATISIKD